MNDSNDRPVLIFFPQWQGSGLTNEVQTGAETLRSMFGDCKTIDIPLSDAPLHTKHKISGYEPLAVQLQTARAILNEKSRGRIVLIAGDCAAEIAPIAYLNERYQHELTVIWLDAHGDLNTPDSSPSGHFHGMPLRLLLEGQFEGMNINPLLTSGQVILAGVRDLDEPESRFIQEHAIALVDATQSWQERIFEILARQNTLNVYIHLDVDVIDPLLFSFLQYPVANGLSPSDLAGFIDRVRSSYNVVGLSMTETTAKTKEDLQAVEPILDVYRAYLSDLPSPVAPST